MTVRRIAHWLVMIAAGVFAATSCRGQTLYVCGDDPRSDGDEGVFQASPAATVKVFSRPAHSGNGALTVDTRGNLYVSTRHLDGEDKDQIVKITPDGTTSVFANAPNVTHLVFDAHDNLYDVEGYADIYRFTPAGKKGFVAACRGSPRQPLADAYGNLYAANYARGRVFKISASGSAVTTLITSIPEPSEIACTGPLTPKRATR